MSTASRNQPNNNGSFLTADWIILQTYPHSIIRRTIKDLWENRNQSFWNNLPIPPVEDIGGVAYVSPLNIVKFLFAHGIPVDDMLVEFHDSEQLKKTSKEQVFMYRIVLGPNTGGDQLLKSQRKMTLWLQK